MPDTSSIRVGFIGAGWTERVQIPTFRMGGLQAQAICASKAENAQRVAQKFEIPEVYATWQELIASPTVDIVSIVTPPDLHAEIAIAALQAGKHVICEKPTALNVKEAEAMLAAAQAAPNQLAIIDHELRFDPIRQQLRQLIREGAVGSVLRIVLDRLGSERLNPSHTWNWWCNAEQGGGMLGAVGSHLFDEARWLIGRVDALTAQLQTAHDYRLYPSSNTQRRVTADDHAQLLLRFANGVQGEIIASGMTPGGYGMSILVIGTEGGLKLDSGDQLSILRGPHFPGAQWEAIPSRRDPAILSELAKLSPSAPVVSPFFVGSYYLAQAVASAIKRNTLSLPEAASFYDGFVAQRALDAARHSFADQTWINL